MIIIEIFIFSKILKRFNFFYLISAVLVGLLTLVTFEPKLPISGHDYSFFLGPIWELANGKTIYTEVPSQYGFLLIHFLTILYKLKLLSLSYLPLFFQLLYIAQFYLVFYLIFKISRSYILSLIAVFSLITINFFSLDFTATMLPQAGPLRWITLIIAMFLFSKIKKFDSKVLISLTAFLSLWVIDAGIYLILSYFLTLFLLLISSKIGFQKSLTAGIWFAISLISLLLTINIIHLLFGLKTIDIISSFAKINQYAKQGVAMLPMDTKSYFWFILLFYFASIIYFFKNKSSPPQSDKINHTLLLFSANLSLFSGIYYVGRSHAHNLFSVAVMALINLFILLAIIISYIKSAQTKKFVYLILFILFIFFPAYQRKNVIAKNLKNRYERYLQGNIFQAQMDDFFSKNYSSEINLIKNTFPEKKILLIQSDDTFLLYYTNKENYLDTNPQTLILSQSDLDQAATKINAYCPKKIVLDCRLVGKCSPFNYLMFADPNYLIQPFLLSRIQDDCKIKYLPSQCTNKLCIAEAK